MKKDNSNMALEKLEKKEKAILEKYLKLKEAERKNKEEIDSIKDEVIALVESKEGKINHNGFNITCHEALTYKYSDSIENIENEIKALKHREQVLNIATVKNATKYVKVYELKKGATA